MSNNPTYVCRHCQKDLPAPPPFSMVVHCNSCMRLTAATVAVALGRQKYAGLLKEINVAYSNSSKPLPVEMPSEIERLRGTNACLERQVEKAIAQNIELEADVKRLRESNGEMDQRLSDNAFYMGKLFARLCAKLNLIPNSDTWFDIADKVEQQTDALVAMKDAFDIGQPATETSAIGKARAALEMKL